jgi:hypothetical protein
MSGVFEVGCCVVSGSGPFCVEFIVAEPRQLIKIDKIMWPSIANAVRAQWGRCTLMGLVTSFRLRYLKHWLSMTDKRFQTGKPEGVNSTPFSIFSELLPSTSGERGLSARKRSSYEVGCLTI